MAKFLRLEAGKLKSYDAPGSSTIYDDYYQVVASGASGPNQINVSAITSGTAFNLPNSGTYLGAELLIYINGQFLRPGSDYTYQGSGTRTQIALSFDGKAGDEIRFAKYRDL